MNKISVAEALRKIESGEPVQDYTVDFDRIRVEALDVMTLAKNGIVVPEKVIYYDDDDIQEDDDFAGEWTRIDHDPVTGTQASVAVNLNVREDIQSWLEAKDIHLDKLLEDLLNGFYHTQKLIK